MFHPIGINKFLSLYQKLDYKLTNSYSGRVWFIFNLEKNTSMHEMLYTGGVLHMADYLYEKTIHTAATLSTNHRHKFLTRKAWWLKGSTRQTVVLQSWVRIRHLPSPQLTAISWWVATWDGTWLRADLCEGRQRRKLRKKETAGTPKT
jgi:hypothetical protein